MSLRSSFFLFLLNVNAVCFGSYAYLGGDLGINYQKVKTSESINWSNALGLETNSHGNDTINGDLKLGYLLTLKIFFLGPQISINFLNNTITSQTRGTFRGIPFEDSDKIRLTRIYEILAKGGYSLRENTQLYGLIGVGFGTYHFIQFYQDTLSKSGNVDNTKTLPGLDLGVGIKENLNNKWSLNLAVQNINFKSSTVEEIHVLHDFIKYSPAVLLTKIGLEYHFY